MDRHVGIEESTWQPRTRPLGQLPLTGLVKRIVDDSDRQALDELHGYRSFFRHRDQSGLLLVGYVDRVRVAMLESGEGLCADEAYSLTIDKFSCLPQGRSGTGPDCRNYFRAFVAATEKALRDAPPMPPLEEELCAARKLQGLVRRHFGLSLRECRRRGYMTRYVWRLPGGQLTLLMPAHLSGRERGTWLAAHVPDAAPDRPGEQHRVQAVIDEESGRELPPELTEILCPAVGPATRGWTDSADPGTPDRLADAIACEKAASIGDQRPAVRALGPDRLRRMILRVFDDLAAGVFSDGVVAREYGLSKATFSRFAGSQWNGDGGNGRYEEGVPDLWRNTAHVLAGVPEFVEAARDAGVWKTVKAVARVGDSDGVEDKD